MLHDVRRPNKKNHMIISINTEKAFDKNSIPIHDKNFQENRNRNIVFNVIEITKIPLSNVFSDKILMLSF